MISSYNAKRGLFLVDYLLTATTRKKCPSTGWKLLQLETRTFVTITPPQAEIDRPLQVTPYSPPLDELDLFRCPFLQTIRVYFASCFADNSSIILNDWHRLLSRPPTGCRYTFRSLCMSPKMSRFRWHPLWPYTTTSSLIATRKTQMLIMKHIIVQIQEAKRSELSTMFQSKPHKLWILHSVKEPWACLTVFAWRWKWDCFRRIGVKLQLKR